MPDPDRPSPDRFPPARFDHLLRLTGPIGLLEHALLDEPRLEHGMCTDDNARALLVLCRIEDLSADLAAAFELYLGFVERGRVGADREAGGWHNRMDLVGRWLDTVGPDDCHGRALWGLGVAAARAPKHAWRQRATVAFVEGADLDSPFVRSTAYAALGAAAAWDGGSGSAAPEAALVLEKARPRLPRPRPGPWRWPEDRLTYANARIPEAMIATGSALGDTALVDDGLDLLDWLVEIETGPTGFSFTPVGGRGPGDPKPAFDQQPIEAWAMADACALATAVTGDARWEQRRRCAVSWFLGANDAGASLYDEATGAGFDGLTAQGPNLNRGAESTLAALAALLPPERPRGRSDAEEPA